MVPRELPIYEVEPQLVAALRSQPDFPRLVLEAPTGSGKSTQVPQILLDHGLLGTSGQVVVLQPRRIAARMLARRVAHERGTPLGRETGYQVRFENHTSAATRIRFVTEGVLLRQILDDPTLPGVAAILFDEFHERHFFGDITLARALQIQESERPDLALIVMSATLDGDRIASYLENPPRVTSSGRTHPVQIEYRPPRERHQGELWDHIAKVYEQHMVAQAGAGDCLVFLPGAFEIRKTIEAFNRHGWAREVDVLPLYGDLSPRQQDRALETGSRPKVVVATNVAETSLTIDGVTLVIDSGLARLADFDARRGISTLTIQKISRASADQRAGRAGRTAPGTCIRLWSEEDHARRAASTPAEIHRMDLAEAVLTLKLSGVSDLESFPWFEAPDPAGMRRARDLLVDLGTLDPASGAVTPLGRDLARFPVTPRFGRVLVAGAALGCFETMASVVALTQGKSIFTRHKSHSSHRTREDFIEPGDVSDFQPALRALEAARPAGFHTDRCEALGIHGTAAREIDRLTALLRQRRPGRSAPENPATAETLARCLLAGFPDQVARRLNRANRACALTGGRRGNLSDQSCLGDAELFVTVDVTEIEGRDLNVLLNLNTAVDRSLLEACFPASINTAETADWDPRERRVEALTSIRYRDLILESKPSREPPASLAAEILARHVLDGTLVLKNWDRGVEQWIARLDTLARAAPEFELPEFTEDVRLAVIEQVCLGAFSYKQIKDREVWNELRAILSSAQQGLLDRFVPEKMDLPNGKRARIRYQTGESPVLSAQLQHLYDIPGTPTLFDGRIPLRIEILAPNQRPVQITENLARFWETSYAAVKTELKGRYPKHEWR